MDSVSKPVVVNGAGQTTTTTTYSSSSTAFSLLATSSERSKISIYDGTQQEIKPSIAVEVDLAYNLRRWLKQKPAEEPLAALRYSTG